MFSQRWNLGLLILLVTVSLFSTAFAWPQPAVDQHMIALNGAGAQPGNGREITGDDWAAHLPLTCATVLAVLVVNGLFIGKIVYNRRQGSIGG